MIPGRWLELLAYFPARTPCLEVRRLPRDAIRKAMHDGGLRYYGGAERVQIQLLGPDRRVVLVDWRASSWQSRRDEAGRRAANQSW